MVAAPMRTTPAIPASVALPFSRGKMFIFIFGSRHDLLRLQQHIGVLCAAAAIGAAEGIGRKGGQHQEEEICLHGHAHENLLEWFNTLTTEGDTQSQARMAK